MYPSRERTCDRGRREVKTERKERLMQPQMEENGTFHKISHMEKEKKTINRKSYRYLTKVCNRLNKNDSSTLVGFKERGNAY